MKGILKIKKDKKGTYLMIITNLKNRKIIEYFYGKVNEIYKQTEKFLSQGYILI